MPKNNIIVLLSTYNGEKYIKEQLNSLYNQKDVEVSILVRDDGSTDSTSLILDQEQQKGRLSWYQGENKGPAGSFMDLLYHAPEADYYAFCDQDDIWQPEKLCRAVEALAPINNDYKVYISPATLVDVNLNVIGQMPLNYKFTIGEAIVTNPATGCTMLFNNKLKQLIKKFPPQKIKMHDEWVYKVCLFMNGSIFADTASRILYRQHGNNVIGAKEPFIRGMVRRIKNIFTGGGSRSATLCELYRLYKDILPKENLTILEKIYNYKRNLRGQISLLKQKGLSAPLFSTMFNFYTAVILKKF